MDCITAQQMIRPYLEGMLSDRELELFLDHVQNCPSCFDELEIYFSIYRTLDNVDEEGNYNFDQKLRTKMENSRIYLSRRSREKAVKVGIVLAAEMMLCLSAWELLRYLF